MLLNFLLHREMRHTLQIDQSECGAILASSYASTLAQSCHLACLVATSLRIIASPKKISVPELNDQPTYFSSLKQVLKM